MAKISIQTQIRSMETIICQVKAGGSYMRASERELLAQHALAIRDTLLFCEAHIAEIQEFIAIKRK